MHLYSTVNILSYPPVAIIVLLCFNSATYFFFSFITTRIQVVHIRFTHDSVVWPNTPLVYYSTVLVCSFGMYLTYILIDNFHRTVADRTLSLVPFLSLSLTLKSLTLFSLYYDVITKFDLNVDEG